MKKVDYRHIAFHVLIALYFIWAVVFTALIAMAVINVYSLASPQIVSAFMLWILFNLIMGTALFVVIRLFRSKKVVGKIVFYSYFLLALASLVIVLWVRSRV